MQTKIWKLFLTALVLALAIVASPRNAQACIYQSWGCQDGYFECCCNRGVICASSQWQCSQFCGD